ncbi:MAG: sigma factor-like helix-turn-helix DNA-binding protein, partial [Romboutsia sp.]|uniref:sigma factor-like helix-turn-helix DNA-binding protein n=1 Tax=Romboutsia sp. TaxID=1965302 RepID=UPI003F3B01A2
VEDENPSYIDTNLVSLEIKEEIESLLSNLNEKDRSLFKKYYLQDISLETIAKESDTSVDNLYNRMSRGRKKLRMLYKR